MEKIAIQGHLTRGNDVIKILESLGGINKLGLEGNQPTGYYYLNNDNIIICEFHSCIAGEYTCYTLEQYEQKFNNMEKRNIQINLVTAKEWYKQGGDLRKIALQAFTEAELQSLPKSWEEYCAINPSVYKEYYICSYIKTCENKSPRIHNPDTFKTKQRAQQFLTLNKLLQIRDYYNQGWKPNWTDDTEEKYCIINNRNTLTITVAWVANYLFVFKTKELRDEFLTNFKEDLEIIKEFL